METLHTSSEKRGEQYAQKREDFVVSVDSHEEVLKSCRITGKRDLQKIKPESTYTNKVYFVSLENGESGIFKPEPKKKLGDIIKEVGAYPQRARAAYLLSQFFELNMVPPTIVREIGDEVGSLQKYISGGRDFYEFAPIFQEELLKKLQKQFATLWVFDYIIWNSDRGCGRNIIMSTDRVYAIDNDYSFVEDKELGQFESFLYTPLPPRFVEKISNFGKDKKAQDSLKKALEELLPSEWVEACIGRILFLSWELERSGGVLSRLGPWYPKK